MAVPGWSLYLLAALLLAVLYRAAPALSLPRLLEHARREHAQVQRVIARHPRGGSWRELRRWLAQDARASQGAAPDA